MFHEFGHALHGMFSNVKYPRFAGTSVPRDFVEYPVAVQREVGDSSRRCCANYAKHYQTGAPMPKELLDKVLAAQQVQPGLRDHRVPRARRCSTRRWHQLTPGADARARRAGVRGGGAQEGRRRFRAGAAALPHAPTSRTSCGGGYSAGYYAYIWSEVLAPIPRLVQEARRAEARERRPLRQKMLSRGFSIDALTMFRDFYGKGPEIGPLLEARGLTGGSESSGR